MQRKEESQGLSCWTCGGCGGLRAVLQGRRLVVVLVLAVVVRGGRLVRLRVHARETHERRRRRRGALGQRLVTEVCPGRDGAAHRVRHALHGVAAVHRDQHRRRLGRQQLLLGRAASMRGASVWRLLEAGAGTPLVSGALLVAMHVSARHAQAKGAHVRVIAAPTAFEGQINTTSKTMSSACGHE